MRRTAVLRRDASRTGSQAACGNRRKRFDGQIMMLYLLLLSVTRFFMEYLRGDAERGFVIEGVLSTSQFIGILLFLIGLAAYVLLDMRARAAEAA